MRKTCQFFGLTAILSASLFCSPVQAAEPGKPADTKKADPAKDARPAKNVKGYDRLRMGPNGIPMPPDRTRSIEARRALDEAKVSLTGSMGNSAGNSTFQIDNELMRNADYRLAVLDLRRAQADYDGVRRPIFDLLRADTYYQELQKKQQASQRVIQQLVLTGRGSFDWLFPHAMAALEVRKRMTREEIMALAQTPEVEESREQMLMAAAKVRALRTNHIAQTTNNAAAKDARASLDVARNAVRAAQAEYNSALSDEADYERIRSDYISELRRTGKAPVAEAN